MDYKAFLGIEIKDADKGLISAVFSTFNVVDSDHDITLPGAFSDGAPVKLSAYGHASWGGFSSAVLPVGKGTIRVGEKETSLEGQFFMKAAHARDTFETIKEMGELQEWSYGYKIDGRLTPESDDWKDEWTEMGAVQALTKLTVHEVSPVLVGAGDTRTTSVKDGVVSSGTGPPVTITIVGADRNHIIIPDRDVTGVKAVKAEPDPKAAEEFLRFQNARMRYATRR